MTHYLLFVISLADRVVELVRSIKYECLNRTIFIGQASLRRVMAEYMDHYHQKRNHQGLNNRLIRAVASSAQGVGPEALGRKQKRGGMLALVPVRP